MGTPITPEAKEQGMLFAKAIFRNVDVLGPLTTARQFYALLRIIACRPAWTEEQFLRFMADDALVNPVAEYDGDGPVEDDDDRHAPDTREEAKGEK